MWICIKETTMGRTMANERQIAQACVVPVFSKCDYQTEQVFDAVADKVTVRVYERIKD
jgi:hypothetical protein